MANPSIYCILLTSLLSPIWTDLAATDLIEQILKSAEQVYKPNQRESIIDLAEDVEGDGIDAARNEDVDIASMERASNKTQ